MRGSPATGTLAFWSHQALAEGEGCAGQMGKKRDQGPHQSHRKYIGTLNHTVKIAGQD